MRPIYKTQTGTTIPGQSGPGSNGNEWVLHTLLISKTWVSPSDGFIMPFPVFSLTGCCPEDLPRAMNDREEWRERVRDIRATSAIWWWWWFGCYYDYCCWVLLLISLYTFIEPLNSHILFLSFESFSHQRELTVFHKNLSDSKFPPATWILLSILADLNNSVLWMVSTCPLISKSSSPCTNPLMTVPRAPITISIIFTFIFYSFFNSLAKFRHLSLFSLSFNFTQGSAGTAKSTIRQVLFFVVDYY